MRQRMGVLRRVLANDRLRRVELAFLGFGAAEYGVWVAVLVYAYERGGTTLTAVIAVVQLLPAAVVAPLAARLADSRGGAATLRIGYVSQAVAIGASAACMLLDAPALAVYAGAIVAASAVTLTRPAQGAFLPQLVDTPAQLTAANVVSGWVESVSLLIGPLLTGVLIAVDGPGLAMALFAASVAASAVLVGSLRGAEVVAAADPDDEEESQSVLDALRSPAVVPLLSIGAAQFVVMGSLDVLEVVLAIKVLGLGSSAAGYLAASFGAGAMLGAVVALSLVGRPRVAGTLLAAAFAWGAALVTVGIWPRVGVAFTMFAAGGATHTVLDVSGRTLLHRAVPPALHGRVFGVLEGLTMAGLACGSILVPLLTGLIDTEAALVFAGGLMIVVPALGTAALRSFERSAPSYREEIALLRRSSLFAMLGPPVLADLARALARIELEDGHTLIAEGELGDHFYLLADGRLEVSIAGETVRSVVPGDGVGEIALLRDGVRTATVTAEEPSTVYALARAPFLEAVTGSQHAQRVADEMVARRLGV